MTAPGVDHDTLAALLLPAGPGRVGFDRLVAAIGARGGRVLLVGGCVRDALMGRPVHDTDVEVRGVEQDDLTVILHEAFDTVDEVGAQFAVYKARSEGVTFDVALPRREMKTGTGHAAFDVTPDPHLSDRVAASRRDFTVNAIAYDVTSGVLVDPFDGLADLRAGILRATSGAFGEDPLRVLRAAQFAARFGMTVESGTADMCRDLRPERDSLPEERVFAEYLKILGGVEPSLGLAFLSAVGWLPAELDALRHQAARSGFTAWTETLVAVDRLAALRSAGHALADPDQQLAVELASLTGRLDADSRRSLLRGMTRLRTIVRDVTTVLDGAQTLAPLTPEAILLAAEQCGGALGPALVLSASGGQDMGTLLAAVSAHGVTTSRLPALVDGRDVMAAGVPAGPAVGDVLAVVRAAQLAGQAPDRETALTLLGTAARDVAVAPSRRVERQSGRSR